MTAKKPPVREAWTPPEWEDADAYAIQRCIQGNADPADQRRAIDWIINAACGTYDLSFRPGVQGDRDTSFAEGRRFVGLQIIKMSKINYQRMNEMKEGK